MDARKPQSNPTPGQVPFESIVWNKAALMALKILLALEAKAITEREAMWALEETPEGLRSLRADAIEDAKAAIRKMKAGEN